MRRGLIAVPVLLAAVLTACSSDGGTPAAPSSGASGGAAPAALAGQLSKAIATVKSAHFSIKGTFGGQQFSGAGDQQLAAGTLTALDAQADLPTLGAAAIVVIGSNRYVKLPPPLGDKSKPWVRVRADSSDIITKQLAAFLDAALAAGSLGSLDELVGAATSLRTLGSEQVRGAATTRYRAVVDPAKLPRAAAGTITGDVPVDLWVDDQHRPVQVHAKPTVAGQQADVTIAFSRFGAPVTITAPPASQVTTG